jgi:hypothetical protein
LEQALVKLNEEQASAEEAEATITANIQRRKRLLPAY